MTIMMRFDVLLCLDEVNCRGGFDGRKIRLISVDDQCKVEVVLAISRSLA